MMTDRVYNNDDKIIESIRQFVDFLSRIHHFVGSGSCSAAAAAAAALVRPPMAFLSHQSP